MEGSEMDNNHIVLEQKLDENNHDMRNQKLEVFDILRTALIISFKKFNFIIFIFLTSLPLFCYMVYYEIFLQTTLVETSNIVNQEWITESIAEEEMTKDFLQKLVQLGFLYLVPLNFIEFCTVIVTVDLASKIYAEERSMTLKEMKEMIHKLYCGARVRGTFITSFYVLFSSTCTLLGLLWLVTTCFLLRSVLSVPYYPVIFKDYSVIDVFFVVFYGAAFVALLTKYLEWSAMWNMSIVISVLERIYGGEAFVLSAYYSKGSEVRGLLLMLVFFVWGLSLRLSCLYLGCYEGGRGIVVQTGLFCLGNVLKWVVCMVYFYDCKRRTLEKKADEEVGREIKVVDA
uniref:Uncharacterized protein n=1 Tax=Fagus sylvatica TaxID=28930 RepID=A0A2N9GPV5_FAGSY